MQLAEKKRIAAFVGRTEWKMSPAMTISSGFCSSRSSTARRNASAMSASRWFRAPWRLPVELAEPQVQVGEVREFHCKRIVV